MPNPLYDALIGPHNTSDAVFLHLACGSEVSFRAFADMAGRTAAALAAAGLAKGDRVAVQVEKSAPALAVYAACVQRGLVFLPLNTAYTGAELTYFLTDSGARALICDAAAAPALAPVAGQTQATLMPMATDGTLDTGASAPPCPDRVIDCAHDDLAAILYTSGTTGRSKGAMLTHGNLLSNAESLCAIWEITASDRLLHALPIFHTHGLFVAINTSLLAGASVIFLPRLDMDALTRWLPQATTMMGVPTFYTRMLADARVTRDLVAHMRLFISGSAPLLAKTHADFRDRTGHRILERYGMTETNMITSNPLRGDRVAGSVGLPLPGVEVRITEPATADTQPTILADGQTGMIELRGPNVFAGYWNMPEKTAEELRPDGWFLTGDLGVIDNRGYLHIVGRAKDIIITGGYNVYPKEVELMLDALPGVLESAVVGLPDPDLGEAVVAFVVPRPGHNPDDTALLERIRPQLARYKQPRAVIFVAALPRNVMGKVQKAQLRSDFAAYLAD